MDEITKLLTELEPDEEIRIRFDEDLNSLVIRVIGKSKEETITNQTCISMREITNSKFNLLSLLFETIILTLHPIRKFKKENNNG